MFSRNYKRTVFVSILLALVIGIISYDPGHWFAKQDRPIPAINIKQNNVVTKKAIIVRQIGDNKKIALENKVSADQVQSSYSDSFGVTSEDAENNNNNDVVVDNSNNTVDQNSNANNIIDSDKDKVVVGDAGLEPVTPAM